MNLKQTLGTFALALLATAYAKAQQPYAQCIFPADVKTWTPAQDKHAKFNRSRVKLRTKITETTPLKANPYQFTEGQVTLESVTAKMCGQTAAQGFDNFIGYNPTYWQYVDKFINWGGADDEGIVVMPPAGTIDAAHMNGVKVLATIFFQNTTVGYTGTGIMLEHDGDKYPQAEQLYKIAKYYGFDGFFINDESFSQNASAWIPFVKAFYAAAEADGDYTKEIQWYNASSSPYDDMLATNKNTSHFLDYGARTYDYSNHAEAIGCTRADLFHKIYNGQECARAGLLGINSALNSAYPRTGHVGSLALFCPEEHTWKDNVRDLFFTDNQRGEVAYKAMQKTYENERKTWVNVAGDPSNTTSYSWRGFSGALVETSTIDALPFYTDFSVGSGKHRFLKGKKQYTRDWSHSGLQSYLPTWRWWIENGDGLTETINWDDAYNVGNSFRIAGNLTAGDHLMRLYKMQAAVPAAGATLRLAFKTNGATPELKLSTESSTTPNITITAETTNTDNGWTIAEYNLAEAAGKTIYMVAFNLKADADKADYELLLGHLDIIPTGYVPAEVQITNLVAENALGDTGGPLRLVWDWAENADVDHFDVYAKNGSGVETLVGQTRDEAYYIWDVKRADTEETAEISVVPVMKDGSEGIRQTTNAEYPKATAPVVKIKGGQNYLTVGQTTTFTASGTFSPATCEWTLPEGLEYSEGTSSSDFTITVKAVKEGKYNVSAVLTNGIGSTTKQIFGCEVMSANDYSKIKNVARGCTVVESTTPASARETVDKLFDGVQNPTFVSEKYCAASQEPYFVIDLGAKYGIYGFNLYDCNAGPETYENISNYKIFVSNDKETWTEVVNETGAEALSIKKDYIEPVDARYVKFQAYAERTMTVRLWEFEVYGKDNTKMIMSAPETLNLEAGEEGTIKVNYNMNGDERDADFKCTVNADNENVIVGEVTEDKDNACFTIPVKSKMMVGTTNLTIKLLNGRSEREMKTVVTIDSKNLTNFLKGKDVKVRYYENDYNPTATYTEKSIAALTDGNTNEDAMADEEDSRKATYDTWAVYESEAMMNLSKVVVYLPNNNIGTDENFNDGVANHDVSIRVSDDGSNWETLKTFENLGEVSKLEYMLPSYRTCKYLGIAFNVNLNFYPAIAEVEAYEQLEDAIPNKMPVAIKSGYNADVIAEALPVVNHISEGVDGAMYAFYSSTANAEGYIADDSRIISTSEVDFRLAPYTENNSLKLSSSTDGTAEGSLVFASAVKAKAIYVIGTSADGASNNVKATVNYVDGSFVDATLSFSDWCGWNYDYAKGGIGRVSSNDDFNTRQNCRLFMGTIETDNSKPIVSVTFSNPDKSNVNIFAISMDGRSVATGIDNVVNGNNAGIEAIYTIDGVKVAKLQRGLNIVRQADGTVKKVLVK